MMVPLTLVCGLHSSIHLSRQKHNNLFRPQDHLRWILNPLNDPQPQISGISLAVTESHLELVCNNEEDFVTQLVKCSNLCLLVHM